MIHSFAPHRSRGMSVFGQLGVLILAAIVVIFGYAQCSSDDRPRPPSGTAGITYLGESDDSPLQVRWDAREGGGQRPAPPLALRLRHTDRYAWWFTGGGSKRWESSDPQGPEEVHLSIAVPGSDSFPAELFAPLCAEDETPFARCRNGLARLIVHRKEYHNEAEKVLTGKSAPPVRDDLPHERRPKQALMEFWTQADADSGRERVAGWVCPQGLAKTEATPPPLATLTSNAPDARLRCFTPGKWWQRMAPDTFGFERHRVYFQCEPKAPCKAAFFHQSRHAELLQENAYPNPESWLDLALFVASWEALERMRLDAIHAPAAMAELEEARIQAQVCEALVGEGKRWARNGSLADDPANSFYPHKAWKQRSLPCRTAADIVSRLAKVEPATVEPMLAALIGGLQRLDTSGVESLFDAWLNALEKSGKANTAQMLDALVANLPSLQSYGEYDRNIPQKLARQEQAWILARTLEPPASADKVGAVARAFAELKRTQKDFAGQGAVYEQWMEWLERHGASRSQRLDALGSLANYRWNAGDFAAFRPVIDRLRDTYLAAAEPAPAQEQESLAGAAFYTVFYYRCYAFHEKAHAEVTPHIAAVIARMGQEFGTDSRYYKAARFHQDEVTRRQSAPNGTPIGGGFLGA